MTDLIRTVQVRIEGRVQGVGYRVWTERTALERGLTGWVRNRSDGSVEALFQGPSKAVEAMLADCEDGPRAAIVRAVEVVGESAGEFSGFAVVETV